MKRYRKGFTMVELIVVLAIIGVASAIIFPLMLSSSGKSNMAAAKAESFYYAAQNIFIDMKSSYKTNERKVLNIDGDFYIDNTKIPENCYFAYIASSGHETWAAEGASATDPSTYIYLCLKADKNSGFTDMWISDDVAESGYASFKNAVHYDSGELLEQFKAFSQNADEGYYFAMIDSQCRVVKAYWSEESIEVISRLTETSADYTKSRITFTDNYVIDSYIAAAYPESEGMLGCIMFSAD